MEKEKFKVNSSDQDLEAAVRGSGVLDKDEGEAKQEKLVREKIRGAKNFNDLYQSLRELGGVNGSQEFYDSQELIGIIELVRKVLEEAPPNANAMKAYLKTVTKTGGLREKVQEFLDDERSEKRVEKLKRDL